MTKKTITLGAIGLITLLFLLAGQRYWAGLGLGLLLGFANHWLLSFGVRWLPTRGRLGFLSRIWGWITPIVYLVKQGVFFVALYLIIRAFGLDLFAFVLGVVGYQGYRLALMIFLPERYLESVIGVPAGQ